MTMPNTFPNPNSIQVKDKLSFRAWCHAMYLTPLQAAALTGRGKEYIYEKLDVTREGKLNETMLNLCNLYAELSPARRADVVKAKLREKGVREPWPAQVPIH
jgi:hypothetical protein